MSAQQLFINKLEQKGLLNITGNNIKIGMAVYNLDQQLEIDEIAKFDWEIKNKPKDKEENDVENDIYGFGVKKYMILNINNKNHIFTWKREETLKDVIKTILDTKKLQNIPSSLYFKYNYNYKKIYLSKKLDDIYRESKEGIIYLINNNFYI